MNKITKVPVIITAILPTGEKKQIIAHTRKITQQVEIKESTNPGSSIKQ